MDLEAILPQAVDFIKQALTDSEENKVLVHCFKGVSRGGSVVIAYLINTLSITSEKATNMVQIKRW